MLFRHDLDVMHIEKNIYDSILGTLLEIKGKTNDDPNARHDLKAMRIRKDLHLECKGDKYIIPFACYTLTKNEKQMLCQFLKDVKLFDAHALNIRRCVKIKDNNIVGLRTHDYHVIFQGLLSLVIHGLLPNKVCELLISLSHFFVEICSKELIVEALDQIYLQIAETLYRLEKVFPLSSLML